MIPFNNTGMVTGHCYFGLDMPNQQSEPGKSTLNVLNYKYKYFPPQKYLSTSTFLFGEMYLSTFRVLSKCT